MLLGAMPGNRKIVTAQESRAIAWKKRNCTSSLLEYFTNKSCGEKFNIRTLNSFAQKARGIFFKWWVLLTEVKWYGPSLPSLELSLLLSYPVLVPGAVTISRSILSQGTEINAEVRHGRNALHYAADAGKVPIVRFLLDNMAIIDVRTYFVNTVIWWFWNHDYIFA